MKQSPTIRNLFALLLLLCALGSAAGVRAQVAGLGYLSVLQSPASARQAALGVNNLASLQGASVEALGNPALLARAQGSVVNLSYVGLSPLVNTGAVAYNRCGSPIGNWALGIQFYSYGGFDGYTEEEISTGSFSAADYVLSFAWGRAIDTHFAVGVSFKPILSHYESFTAFGIAFDLQATFRSSNERFVASLLLANEGAQLFAFDQKTERIPCHLSAAISYRLSKAPFRFYLSLNEMQKWNLLYDDPLNPTSTTDPFTGTVTTQSGVSKFFTNLGCHTIFGVEAILSKSFTVFGGYSFRKAHEMAGANTINTSGFSFGLNFNVKRIAVGYAHYNYHQWQGANYLTLGWNL